VTWTLDPPRATLTGRVVDANGAPRAGLAIVGVDGRGVGLPTPRTEGGGVLAEDTTDAAGTFTLRALPQGNVLVVPRWDQEALAIVGERVRIDAGRAQPSFVELVVPETWRLTGRAVDRNGGPVAGASVRVAGPDGSTLFIEESDAQGRFELAALAPGEVEVVAYAEERRLTALPVRASPDGGEVVLRLLPPGRLVVRIVDAATGAPTVADELWQHGYYERSATLYEEALDVGTYSIVARCLDGRVGAVAAIVEPEHTTTVELALAPGADLRLQRARGGPEEVRARVFAGDAELPS
jgi:hypothetical protein